MKQTAEPHNFLDTVYSLNTGLEWEVNADGIVTVFIKNTGFWNSLVQKLFHRPAVSKLTLDVLGSFIWQLIDGNIEVYEIGQSVKEKFGDSAEPLYERLTLFLRQLESNGLIERKH